MSLYACCDHCSMRGPHEGHAAPCAALCSQGAERANKAPSSPVETTEADLGATSYTGVIRGADDADKFATIADLWRVIEANGATNSRLMRERDEARAEVTRLTRMQKLIMRIADTECDARDATIERIWAQLNEATNVPLVMHEPGCSLDTDHKGSCVRGERIENHAPSEPAPVDVCPCSRCAHYRDVAASVAAKAKP